MHLSQLAGPIPRHKSHEGDNMPLHNVSPRDLPTADDASHWRCEREAYSYHAPNPRAPQDRPDFKGWGIPPHSAAPMDAIDWVIGKYREDDLNIYKHDPRDRNSYVPVHPAFTWSLAAATLAHFVWFRTGPGAEWINNFFGVQEVDPFFEGYTYYWAARSKDAPNADPIEIRPGLGKFKIFRQWERVVDPACPGQAKGSAESPFQQMVKVLECYRDPLAPEPGQHDEGVFDWVSDCLRRWFLEPAAEDRWPFYKKGRISGPEWVRQQTRSDGSPFYEAIDKIIKYHHAAYTSRTPGTVRAYMFIDPSGRIFWCGSNEMGIVPKVDDHRVFKKDMTEEQINKKFFCQSCRHIRSCVPYTTQDHLCCFCFAKQIEGGSEMPTLNKCTMTPECSKCPDVIDSNNSLVSLKQRWNREPKLSEVP